MYDPFPSTIPGNNVIHVWDDENGHFVLRVGWHAEFPTDTVTITQAGNVYAFTGGSVGILRGSDSKRDMRCRNLDTIQFN